MLFSARPRRIGIVNGFWAGLAGAAATAGILAAAGALGPEALELIERAIH
jgi:hypothetical protein